MQVTGPSPASVSTDTHLQSLASVLEQLETYPNNVALVKQQIDLMSKLQMYPEVLDATMRLASLIILTEGIPNPSTTSLIIDQWLKYLDQLIQGASSPLTLDTFVEILERFEQAEQDYLCKYYYMLS